LAHKPLIVIDTNVLVAGLRSNRGWAYQVLARIGGEMFEHCVSVPLLLEYEEVLKRNSAELGLALPEIESLLDHLAETGRKSLIYFQVGPVTPDQDDEMVLELAIAARADRIVTFNVRHFAEAPRFGVIACTPIAFCAEFGISV
jgi:putative PIN family toxin of toxin-antitoxin system